MTSNELKINSEENLNGIELFEEDENGHRHSICVGKKCAYCMDCGKILLEYKNKKDFYKLMNPISEES